MMRTLGIFFGLLMIFLVGLWTQKLRQQIAEQQTRIHHLEQKIKERDGVAAPTVTEAPPAPRAQGRSELQRLQADLEIEKGKLAALEKAEPPTDGSLDFNVDAKIADDKAAIAQKNAELGNLAQDSQIVDMRSRAYRSQETQRLQNQKADLKNQIDSLSATLQNTQVQLQAVYQDKRDPDRKAKIQNLKAQIDQLRAQRKALQADTGDIDARIHALSQAVHAEVEKEQHEVAFDRGAEQRQLNELKSDLERWNKKKLEQSSRVEAQKQARRNYDQAVRTQTARIQALEDEIHRAQP